MKIVADQAIPYVKDFFANDGELFLKPGREISRADVEAADMLLVRAVTPITAQLLMNTKVRFVGSMTSGDDHIDQQWLTKAGIQYAIAYGFNTIPVADYIISTIASLQQQKILHTGKLKIAVIGVGRIGSLVAKRLKQLNFQVSLCDPIRASAESDFLAKKMTSLTDMDVITCHVPLTTTGEFPTYRMIDENFLSRQKPGCVLINSSRGAIIDSSALLRHGKHLIWCFDVWEHEPFINESILAQAFIATPHIAGYSAASRIRGIQQIYQAACKSTIIKPKQAPKLSIPTQLIALDKHLLSWQHVVLSIFDPLLITTKWRAQANAALHFDELRNEFLTRREFNCCAINNSQVTPQDRKILQALDFSI
jgi:erythronate-4-phosphate dehydrogenase